MRVFAIAFSVFFGASLVWALEREQGHLRVTSYVRDPALSLGDSTVIAVQIANPGPTTRQVSDWARFEQVDDPESGVVRAPEKREVIPASDDADSYSPVVRVCVPASAPRRMVGFPRGRLPGRLSLKPGEQGFICIDIPAEALVSGDCRVEVLLESDTGEQVSAGVKTIRVKAAPGLKK